MRFRLGGNIEWDYLGGKEREGGGRERGEGEGKREGGVNLLCESIKKKGMNLRVSKVESGLLVFF